MHYIRNIKTAFIMWTGLLRCGAHSAWSTSALRRETSLRIFCCGQNSSSTGKAIVSSSDRRIWTFGFRFIVVRATHGHAGAIVGPDKAYVRLGQVACPGHLQWLCCTRLLLCYTLLKLSLSVAQAQHQDRAMSEHTPSGCPDHHVTEWSSSTSAHSHMLGL